MTRRKRPLRGAATARRLACAALAWLALVGTDDAQEGSLRVETAGGLVSVEARGVPLAEVLRELARQADLDLRLEAPLAEPVDLSLEGLPLRQAVERILADREEAWGWRRPSPAKGAQGGTLWVFAAGPGEGSPPPPPARQPPPVADDARLAELVEALADPDTERRLEAVYRLVDLGEPALGVLAQAALTDVDAEVREEAISGLAEVGGADQLPVLEKALGDEDLYVREAVVWAIVEIGGDDAVRVLALALGDPEATLREEVVNALGEIGGASAVELLEQALEDESEAVRDAAAEYLEELVEEG